jgi:hypothetical protein
MEFRDFPNYDWWRKSEQVTFAKDLDPPDMLWMAARLDATVAASSRRLRHPYNSFCGGRSWNRPI